MYHPVQKQQNNCSQQNTCIGTDSSISMSYLLIYTEKA